MATDSKADALAGLDTLTIEQGRGDSSRGAQATARLWRGTWPKLLAVALVIGAWQIIHLTGWKRYVLPGPSAVFSDLWEQMHHPLLWQAIEITMRRAVVGFALSVLLGALIGALVSRIRPLRAATGSMITALQTMPSIAWFPFAIILFGTSTAAILFVIVLGSAPSVANGLISGVDYTPPLLLRAGKMMGLSRIALYRHLILPASLPSFVAGLKQAWAFAWRSLMAGELLVIILGQPSIGTLLSTNQDQSDMAAAIAVMVVILVLGIVVDALFGRADGAIRKRWGVAEANAA
ncbi:MAG TPA: ABC transporter permease [Streptosporangiaceae bacterium]